MNESHSWYELAVWLRDRNARYGSENEVDEGAAPQGDGSLRVPTGQEVGSLHEEGLGSLQRDGAPHS